MSGSGIRVFASGEILTAAQVNGYLMDQSVTRFADAATRDASFGGAGQPVLSEGRICYLDDVNLVQFFDGTSWQSSAQFTVGDGTITSAKILNETIMNADISASAAISLSKLATGALPSAITVTSENISNLSIVNDDVSASAAIAHTKLANATAGQVLLGTTTTGVVTATTVSGDVTITGAGVTAIGSGVIVDADVSPTAAIGRGKIADMSIDTKTGNYTLVLTDANKLIEMNITSTANTVSVPTDASIAFPIGTQINITQYGTGKTQILAVTSGTTSIRSTPGSYLRDRYSSATLIKRATDEWYLIGDLSAS